MEPQTNKALILASSNWIQINFSGLGTTSSKYLTGPGDLAGDGFPVLYPGLLHSIGLWYPSLYLTEVCDGIALSVGDRLSFYLTNTGTNYTARVRLNGVNVAALSITGIPYSVNVYATVIFTQERQ